MPELIVNGRSFRDLDSYNAAKSDFEDINRIKERYDLNDLNVVTKLRDDIESGRYEFESVLGDDFFDELNELVKSLSEKQSSEDDVVSKRIGSKSRKSTKKDVAQTLLNRQGIENESLVNFAYRMKRNIEPDALNYYEDDILSREVSRIIKHKERRRRFLIVLMAIIACVSLGYLAFYSFEYKKNDIRYDDMSKLVDMDAASTDYSINLTSTDESKPRILKKYESVYQKNNKVIGWIRIEGTNIDYPVMQTVNNEYYLDHNYDQEYDKNGSIFLDKDCDPAFPNDNMIIYGHHMKSGKMFGKLNLYANEEYYKEHSKIVFDTIYEEGVYEVMYVFRSHIYSEEEIVFKYYKFIDATSEDEFDSNMDQMAALSLYDTGVSASYGDKLITLSTCDSSEDNGRFVVVAKKID